MKFKFYKFFGSNLFKNKLQFKEAYIKSSPNPSKGKIKNKNKGLLYHTESSHIIGPPM